MARPDIHSLSPSVQVRVVQLIEAFATPAVVQEHAVAPAASHDDGYQFLDWHRQYVGRLEAFLARGGLLLPAWNPTMPIPEPFFRPTVGPEALRNRRPGIDFTSVMNPAFCRLTTAPALGAAIIPLHNRVHDSIGGVMADRVRAPASPIFWPLHAFIDDIWAAWEIAIRGQCP